MPTEAKAAGNALRLAANMRDMLTRMAILIAVLMMSSSRTVATRVIILGIIVISWAYLPAEAKAVGNALGLEANATLPHMDTQRQQNLARVAHVLLIPRKDRR